MKCPHCMVVFHDNWDEITLYRNNRAFFEKDERLRGYWTARSAQCSSCKSHIIQINQKIDGDRIKYLNEWRQIYPIGSNRGPVPREVPNDISSDYTEACNVLPISPKASAALSRRCLQIILNKNGYVDKSLAHEIDLILSETDPLKALPLRLRETIDGIRNFGNFAAHPVDDNTALQIIEVEPHEAEWCLEIIEELFDHFYVAPAQISAKKAALNAKLAAAGKPPSKN